jgi:hypothetical protein
MTLAPRCVLVERQTEFRDLLARHGTREQARFFLSQRGLALADVEERHLHHEEVRARVLGALPPDWRSTTVQRSDLDRFLFTAEDVVIVLGQDGLVANVAKYLDGQPVIGLNPEPDRFPGVLVNQAPDAVGDLCADLVADRARFELRTMVRAGPDDGQALLALNEIFVGHRSHQSARYRLGVGERQEHQSSSGLIAASGTGATGWAMSINRQRARPLELPLPTSPQLAWFVREAWESPTTGATLTGGMLAAGAALEVTSELAGDGVVFGDGIEGDRLPLDWGRRVHVGVARERLLLVAQASTK